MTTPDEAQTGIAQTRRYRLVHSTVYTYSDEVSTSYGRAHLVPRDIAGQRCLSSQVLVDPPPAEQREHVDFYGNRSTYFAVDHRHTRLTVTAASEVEVVRAAASADQLADIGWEQARDGLHGPRTLDPEVLDACGYLLGSPLVNPGAAADYATLTFTPGRAIGECLQDLFTRIYTDFTFKSGSTTVRTTLPEVLASRTGVCQDFAHLAVGACRSVGLAARYVSGYVETRPPPGQARLEGADASHAWASLFVPDVGWIDFDPTNNQFVDSRYVVVAWGRDYGDVPPLKGVIFTEATKSTMQVSVDMAAAQD